MYVSVKNGAGGQVYTFDKADSFVFFLTRSSRATAYGIFLGKSMTESVKCVDLTPFPARRETLAPKGLRQEKESSMPQSLSSVHVHLVFSTEDRETFQDEYRAFLRRHGIAWNERFVWE